jgi:hypothetical protein
MAEPKTAAGIILSKYKKAKDQRQLKNDKWNELDNFDRGEQWDDASVPKWIPKPVTNFIHLVKTTKRAALAIENPVGKLRALSPLDIVQIEKLQKIYENEWKVMKARSVVRSAIETSRLLGTGIVQLFWDENTGVMGGTGTRFEGQVKAREIDPAIFFPDPTAFCLDDCQYVHLVERKAVAWLKKHPLFSKGMNEVESRTVALEERGEIYNRDYQSSSSSTDGIIDFHSHYEKIQLSEGGYKYKVTYLAGEKIIHTIEDLQPRCYPFSVLYDFPQRQDFWGKGTCELILENQKIINKVESIIALIGTMLQNPQKILHKRARINPNDVKKFGSASGHVWVSDIDPRMAMTWVTPPAIPQALFNLAEQAKANIREITGLTEAYMGQTVGSMQTSSGVHSLIERSTMRDRDQMYDLELFIEDFSRKMLKFITTKYTDTRYAMLLKDKYDEVKDSDFFSYVGADYFGMDYEFAIDVSSKAPISRAREKDDKMNLLNIQGQYQFDPPVITPEEFVKSQNYPDADAILDRMESDSMRNELEEAMQVANMMHEATMAGVPEEEVQQMAMKMLQSMEEQQQAGTGSASTSGQMQNRQQGATL